MAAIFPVSLLRSGGNEPEKGSAGEPVLLTGNGRGAYSIRDMADGEHFQKAEAMIRLMSELNAGIRSAEEDSRVSEEALKEHFQNRGKEIERFVLSIDKSVFLSKIKLQDRLTV